MIDFKNYSEKNCEKKLSQRELQLVQLDMLNALVKVCEDNNLHYYLSGGTLLGAVRHNGFIPWDDDIDINMPRPDCEKLQKITHGQIGDFLIVPPTPIKGCFGESWRMYDLRTVLKSTMGKSAIKNPVFHPVFIDIFPIEGLPNTIKDTKKHYRKITVARLFERTAFLDHPISTGSNILAKLLHMAILPLAKGIGYSRWYNIVQNIAKRYSFEECDYIGVMTAPVHKSEERVKKSEYIPSIKVKFEGKYYSGPKNYDTYLTQLYGKDYMQIPPIEKQKSHHDFEVFWYKEELK